MNPNEIAFRTAGGSFSRGRILRNVFAQANVAHVDITVRTADAASPEAVLTALMNAADEMRRKITTQLRRPEPTALGSRVLVDAQMYVLMQRSSGDYWMPVAGPRLAYRVGELPNGWTSVD